MDVEPLVEAGPAEEVTAEGHHGILRQVQADVALEAARILAAAATAGAAVGPRHRLAAAAPHAAGIRRSARDQSGHDPTRAKAKKYRGASRSRRYHNLNQES